MRLRDVHNPLYPPYLKGDNKERILMLRGMVEGGILVLRRMVKELLRPEGICSFRL